MYYKIVGPIDISNPSLPPAAAWVDGMRDWALDATVLFVRFTAKYGDEYGATVKVCELSPDRTKTPAIKIKNIELPYSWLAPLPNYYAFDGAPGGVRYTMKMDVIR